jgi:hypothetical protein
MASGMHRRMKSNDLRLNRIVALLASIAPSACRTRTAEVGDAALSAGRELAYDVQVHGAELTLACRAHA